MCDPLLGSVLAGLLLGCSGDVVEEPVASGDTALPETSDPLTTGTVDVTIEGLPPDVKADVTLVGGPSHRSRDVTASLRGGGGRVGRPDRGDRAHRGERRDGWRGLSLRPLGSPLARLVATDPDEDISFGEAVAIQGRTAIVGAWKHPAEGSPDRGVVYFFDLP